MGRFVTLVVFAVGMGCLLCPGCAPTYRDPTTGVAARYEWETLRADVDRPVCVVYDAARDAVCDLDLRSLRCGMDGISGEVIALDAQFDTVDIRIGALPQSRSRLTIRVGLFGDKNKSIVLFHKIMDRLARWK